MPSAFKTTPKVKTVKGNSASPIISASDLMSADGEMLFSSDDISAAIEGFSEAHVLEERAKSMKSTHRPVVELFSKIQFAKLWDKSGTVPANPKITSNKDGTGSFITSIFLDKEAKLDSESFARLANTIGEKNAEENVVHIHEYVFNSDLANQTLKIGKTEKTIMEHVDDALNAKFKDHPEVMDELFEPREIHKTKKGLKMKLLQFLSPGPARAYRLVDALDAARVAMQLKPGSSK